MATIDKAILEAQIRQFYTKHKAKQIDFWRCDRCGTRFASERIAEPQTWRLHRLKEAVTPSGYWQSDHPTWKVAGPDPSVCPECMGRMTKQIV